MSCHGCTGAYNTCTEHADLGWMGFISIDFRCLVDKIEATEEVAHADDWIDQGFDEVAILRREWFECLVGDG